MKMSISYPPLHQFWTIVGIMCIATTALAQTVTTQLAGQCTVDGIVAVNMNTLNCRGNDWVWNMRSTIDYSLDVKLGDTDAAMIQFYDAVRFRYVWGSFAETYVYNRPLVVAGAFRSVAGSSVNKHLLWMREGWLKFDLNNVMTKRNIRLGSKLDAESYVQLGLIPYQVGRGISLGAAYDSSSYLGFKSDFYIDQYAPAALINFNVVPDKYSFNVYGAILKNKQSTVGDTVEAVGGVNIQSMAIGGTCRQSYIIAWDHKLHHLFCNNIDIEPYVVYLGAPDQKVEFLRDTDITLLTIGIAVEAVYTRWSWGCEGAFNLGEALLKAWDRNALSIDKNDNGYLVSRYTKVYDQDPALKTAMLAQETTVNDQYVNGSAKSCKMNGQKIGPHLYNAYDRFRAAQTKFFDGYFFLADASYDVVPTVLQWAFGAGYASGDCNKKTDTNAMSHHQCMNQTFSGFIPLQSEYTGTRIHHIIALNQGLPRCNNLNSADTLETNLINDIQSATIQDLTNIAFVGTRIVYNPTVCKSYGLMLSGNCVGYWTPQPVYIDHTTHENRLARNFLGVELSTEFEWTMWQKIKCAGYAGLFLPGFFYRDNHGKVINDFKSSSGSDIGFIGNVALMYEF